MIRNHSTEEERETSMASEPAAIYGIVERKIFSEEELSQGIPVEESRRRLTELIYNHYHQQ